MSKVALLLCLAAACSRAEAPSTPVIRNRPAEGGVEPARTTPANRVLTDEQLAFDQARREGKAVMIEFTAAWCTPCAELRQALASGDLAPAIATDFVWLEVDVTEDRPQTAQLRARHGADTLPAIVFIRTEGTVLGRIHQLLDRSQLRAIIDGAASKLRAKPSS